MYGYMVSGTIDFSDFLTMMTQKMAEKDSKEEILKAFRQASLKTLVLTSDTRGSKLPNFCRLFDDDETGKISFKNLKRVAKELGENLTDEELQVRRSFLIRIHILQRC